MRGRYHAENAFSGPVRPGCNGFPNHHKCRNRARIGRICLECAAIFGHLPLTIRCRLGDYTRAMMIKRILTICAAVWRPGGGGAATSLALGAELSAAAWRGLFAVPASRLGGYPADYRRGPGAPDFDALEDDDGTECAEFDRAAAARPGAFARRSALWPADGRSAGLFRPRDRPARCCRPTIRAMAGRWALRRSIPTARPTGPIVARRSALWPPRRPAAGDLFRPSRQPTASDRSRRRSWPGRRLYLSR